jgi:hypothetical protein
MMNWRTRLYIFIALVLTLLVKDVVISERYSPDIWSLILIALTIYAFVRLIRQLAVNVGQATVAPDDTSKVSPADTSQVTPEQPAAYTTGVLIVPPAYLEDEVHRQLRDWPKKCPNDASVAVAAYDEKGGISLQVYETKGGALLWEGGIGALYPSDIPKQPFGTPEFTRAIVKPVTAYVHQILGTPLGGVAYFEACF